METVGGEVEIRDGQSAAFEDERAGNRSGVYPHQRERCVVDQEGETRLDSGRVLG